MGSHLAKLGRALDGAADAYNSTVSSLETRVLVSARRFADLHVVDADLPTPPPANPRLSAVSAPELVASVEEQVVAFDGIAARDARAFDEQRADPPSEPGRSAG
jgi:DNA recombination protein RmuC